MTGSELRALLLTDGTAWVDGAGRLYYVEPEPRTVTASARRAALSAATPTHPLSETFELHSLPGSSRTIYLDFDGADVSGTAWNAAGLPDGLVSGWSLDDTSSFDDAELGAIQEIWAGVSEDFAPFDVDVTTADPGQAAINRSGPDDDVFGTSVVITGSEDAMAAACVYECSGAAYLGVFDDTEAHSFHQPAFIFSGPGDDDYFVNAGIVPKVIANAASHEVGHTLGLHHDGLGRYQQYYAGNGLWGPIMGAGVNPIEQWSRGTYPNATNHEDDLEIIANGGAPYRADEPGSDDVSSAGPLPSGGAVIGRPTDTDTFAIGACDGPLSVAALPSRVDPDLDIRLTLVDSRGDEVAIADPLAEPVRVGAGSKATGLGAAISVDVPEDDYYVMVDGVGRDNSDGSGFTYEDYASLGAFTVTASCSADLPGPPAGLTAVWTKHPFGDAFTLAWLPPESSGATAVTGYSLQLGSGAEVVLPPTYTSFRWVGPNEFRRHRFSVRALNAAGAGPAVEVRTRATTSPGPVRAIDVTAGDVPGTLRLTWLPPVRDGGSPITGYAVRGSGPDYYYFSEDVPATPGTVDLDGLRVGDRYHLSVHAHNYLVGGPWADTMAVVGAPDRPDVLSTEAGRPGGKITARVQWRPSGPVWGEPVTGYRVFFCPTDRRCGVRGFYQSPKLPPTARSYTLRPDEASRYTVQVRALNAVGPSQLSLPAGPVWAR